MVAVTLQGADAGDTATIIETAIAATEQIEDAQADVTEPQTLDEIIADQGYHSNQTMVDLDAVGLRSRRRRLQRVCLWGDGPVQDRLGFPAPAALWRRFRRPSSTRLVGEHGEFQ